MSNEDRLEFEVTVEKTVTQVYRVFAKDEDVAGIVARGRARRDENGIYVDETIKVRKTERLGPRFIVRGHGEVFDIIHKEVRAACRYKNDAERIAELLNEEEK